MTLFLQTVISIFLAFDCQSFSEDESERARAILEAVAEAREMDSFHIEVEIETEFSHGVEKLVYRILKDKDQAFVHFKRFIDQKPDDETKFLQKGDLYYTYEIRDSVSIVYLRRFSKEDADEFDFRIIKPGLIGLKSSPLTFDEIRNVLRVAYDRSFTLNQRQTSNGNQVSVIRCKDGASAFTYEIEDATLRVKRVVYEYFGTRSNLKIETDSSYGKNDVFPDSCVILRTNFDGSQETTKVSLKFLPSHFDESNFELASLELPLGTMCIDQRINKIIGYWNGSEFVENYYDSFRAQPEQVAGSFPYLNTVIVISVLAVVTLTVIYLKKQR